MISFELVDCSLENCTTKAEVEEAITKVLYRFDYKTDHIDYVVLPEKNTFAAYWAGYELAENRQALTMPTIIPFEVADSAHSMD